MSRVLVTGGAGYIGSHAVKALIESGHDVVVYDNLCAGHRAAVQRIAAEAPDRVRLVDGDIRDTARVADALAEAGADAVMHFAALLSVGDSVKDPVGYYDNNVRGALSVLQAMVQSGTTQFIFSYTAATFGNPTRTPITEDHPQAPINAYGETKLAIERALPHYERAYGLRSIVLRYFNAAGAHKDGTLGEDLASAHLLALQSLGAGGPSDAYNLGNGRPISVREVVDSVERVTGKWVPVGSAPRRPGDPGVLYTSSDKIRRTLGWAPQFEELDVIVETAWRWREAHPHGYQDDAR